MTYVTCRLTAKNPRDQLRNPTLGNRVWATFLQYRAYIYTRTLYQTTNKLQFIPTTVAPEMVGYGMACKLPSPIQNVVWQTDKNFSHFGTVITNTFNYNILAE